METPLHPTPMARPMMKGKIFVDVSNKPTFQVRPCLSVCRLSVSLAGWIVGVWAWERNGSQDAACAIDFVLVLRLTSPPPIQFVERANLHRTFRRSVGPSCHRSIFSVAFASDSLTARRYHQSVRHGEGGRWRGCAGSLPGPISITMTITITIIITITPPPSVSSSDVSATIFVSIPYLHISRSQNLEVLCGAVSAVLATDRASIAVRACLRVDRYINIISQRRPASLGRMPPKVHHKSPPATYSTAIMTRSAILFRRDLHAVYNRVFGA